MKHLYREVRAVPATEQPFVESLEFERLPDRDGDSSFLEQEGFEDRLAAYRRGDFGFIGVRVMAVVAYRIDANNLRLERFTSAGLWGIEDDSDAAYLREVEAEELIELKDHLSRFGVDTTLIDRELDAREEGQG